ncbi:ATP-binding cassette domain-containing protein [Alloiococcus sp. CFN-8]|uniref:ATP-binding cassette domain-containing protein n=1 Tax=Alloiococcus sp. CFN-8 TaxID=3416081 RepID=UPI003CF89120
MTNTIECKGLSKSYGKVKAVNNISLTLENNKIYGLLGRNGAGKTTLLRMLNNELVRSEGEVKYEGMDIFENSKALENICLVKDRGSFDEDKKVKDIFKLASICYKNWDEDYKNKLVKKFNVNVKKSFKKLSRGGQSLVGVIIGLASRAPVTIFDEPVLGLDAAVREEFYSILLKDYEENPRTIVISTHLIEESSNVFEEIIMIDSGELILKESISELMEKAKVMVGNREKILSVLDGKTQVIHEDKIGGASIISVFDNISEDKYSELKKESIEVSQLNLQKLFVYLTKKDGGEE